MNNSKCGMQACGAEFYLAPGHGGVCPECSTLNHWAYASPRYQRAHTDEKKPVTPDPKPVAVAEPAGGMKFDSGKPRWSLLMGGCGKALAGVAAVLTFGAAKYAAHSWKQVENNKERYRDAMYRHLNAIESGEELDPESGLPHWDHVACNALFLSELNKESK